MTTLEIKIPAKGQMKGTCAWAKKLLENAQLKIYRDKKEDFAIGVKFKDESNFTTVAFITAVLSDDGQRCYFYREETDTYEVYAQENEEDYTWGRKSLFGTLTKSAENYIEEFIKKCSISLREYVDQDEEIPFDLQIIKK